MNSTRVPKHIAVRQDAGKIEADCAVCDQAIDIPRRFGGIPAGDLLQAWIKQHAHGRPA